MVNDPWLVADGEVCREHTSRGRVRLLRGCFDGGTMRRDVIFVAACVLFVAASPASASAQSTSGPAAPGLYHPEWQDRSDRSAEPEPKQFSLINYFFARGTVSNVLADPSGLRGVSLGPYAPGLNSGSNTGVDNERWAYFVEQRWIPVFEYKPLFVDGLAAFRAQFEVDYTWGLAANAVQNNQGGGFNADQVNIQTKNVNVAIYPTRKSRQLSLLIGTHSIYDTPYDPTITSLFDIVQTGYKLTFIGTDATGLSLFARTRYGRARAAFIPMGGSQPDRATDNDPRFRYATMGLLDYVFEPRPGTNIGLSYWRLQDNTKGRAFAFEGLVNSGPGSSALKGYMGTQRFNIEQATGHVNYLGTHFHHNLGFRTSNFAASGFLMYNVGRFENNRDDSQALDAIDISGLAANLELKYNWGRTEKDRITLEGIFTTGDDDPLDDKYSGPFTMNYYGLPGAVWFNHKTLLLFPFTSTVSNYTGAVTDISNRGYGLAAGIATASMGLIPNKLNLKIGAAFGASTANPPAEALGDVGNPGQIIGTEINAELEYQIRYLMTVGLHTGYMFKGNFYAGSTQVTDNPFAAFTTFTWYAF